MSRQLHEVTQHKDARNSACHQDHSSPEQIYACRCGKEYKSFAAIYLHFRTKHDLKLSTRPSETRRKVEYQGPSRRFVFSPDLEIEKKEDDSQEHPSNSSYRDHKRKNTISCKSENVEGCVKNFLNSHPLQDQEIYKNFLKFLSSPEKIMEGSSTPQISSQTLPLYFNSFAVEFLPEEMPRVKMGTLKWKKACYSLQVFGNWLRQNEKTNLITICDLK